MLFANPWPLLTSATSTGRDIIRIFDSNKSHLLHRSAISEEMTVISPKPTFKCRVKVSLLYNLCKKILNGFYRLQKMKTRSCIFRKKSHKLKLSNFINNSMFQLNISRS